jgi:hypothetical protein
METDVMKLRGVGPTALWLWCRASRFVVVAASLAALAALVVFVWLTPWVFGFAGAVAAALVWSAWLDRHLD